MTPDFLTTVIVIAIIFIIIAIIEVFILQKNRKFKEDLMKREEDAKQKMYEIEILSELSDKMGYSLGAQNVTELIIESLPDIIEYSAVSYMLLLPEKIVFRSHIQKPVPRKFIDDVKAKMLDSLSALLNADFKNMPIEETLWGQLAGEESNEQVGSFFNVPITISKNVAGLLNVADARVGFYKEKEINIVNRISQQATQAVSKLQQVVESEKSKLSAMVASMTDGVVMTDMDYNILVVNPAARKALGFDLPAQAGNKNDFSISDIETGLGGKFNLKDKVGESIKLEKVFVSDQIALKSNFFQIIISPVKDVWKALGCVVVLRDITHEKEVQQLKEDFTSMIVHELRSPLDSIKKMAELMRTSKVKKANQGEYLQMMHASSSDMLELINNLLDIAKIEAGKFEIAKQKSDIKKLIESRILFFNIAAKDANVKLTGCFGKDVPDVVEFDPHAISQVLNNLISNAIKFTKENGSVTVQALLHKAGQSLEKEAKDSGINWFVKDITLVSDSLVVAVTDNGIGIAPDQINKLFNKFIQAKSTFVEKGGTGLGLAITKSIIDSHGGVVGVESIQGQGSTFYFTLPINI